MAKILVRATQTGFFGHKRIKEGQTFELADLKLTKVDPKTKAKSEVVIKAEDQFSELWMEKVDTKKEKVVEEKKIKFEQNDDVEVI